MNLPERIVLQAIESKVAVVFVPLQDAAPLQETDGLGKSANQ